MSRLFLVMAYLQCAQNKRAMEAARFVCQNLPLFLLIGKTVDEAIPELDKYLDDAYLAHLEKVRVVHGRGTGALRNGVHQHLRKLKYVKSFHLGEFGEGDSGVTIVTFK